MTVAESSVRRRQANGTSKDMDGAEVSRSHDSNTAQTAKAGSRLSTIFRGLLPFFMSWGLVACLIFGGCCSNVFALEAIVKEEPESGLLITFTQFLVTFVATLPPHLSLSRPPWFLKEPVVPLLRWAPAILMFFTVNMMNNFAFGYQISVPVHIILRSGGSVATMLVGYLWGKRYNKGQVLGVTMLTVGVIVAAMADAQSKGKMDRVASNASNASFWIGLGILFIAQLLSAIMGLYVQLTYARFGPHWNENLFYSHFLSLPLFVPFYPMLWSQLKRLVESPVVVFRFTDLIHLMQNKLFGTPFLEFKAWTQSDNSWSAFTSALQLQVPIHLVTLMLNSVTQYACIRGVNLLGARTSALGVTIVLNLRKLVSLFISICLFGNVLPAGVTVGAAIVFAGAGVYAWAGQSRPRPKTE